MFMTRLDMRGTLEFVDKYSLFLFCPFMAKKAGYKLFFSRSINI